MSSTYETLQLSHFLRHPEDHLERMRESQLPEVLLINGKAEAVIQDAASYEKLMKRLEQAESLEGCREGFSTIAEGKGIPSDGALQEIRTRLKIARDG